MKNINIHKLITLFVFCFLLFININSVFAYTFSNNLNIGTSNEDVRQLQIFLNNYSIDTQIAINGVGSKGNETNYFGNLTKNALIKFQNLNYQSILAPVGLISGTGYFGPSTRNFINSLNTSSNIPTENFDELVNNGSNNILQTQTEIINNNPIYLYVSKKVATENDEISVGSSEDISNMEFYLNDIEIDKKCKTNFFCTLEIDDITKGDYVLSTNNSQITKENIKIVDSKKPKIKTSTIKLNTDNKISGDNLSDNIKVHTIFGSSETQTQNDSFVLRIESSLTVLSEYLSKGPIYVTNDDGLVSDIIIVNYEI